MEVLRIVQMSAISKWELRGGVKRDRPMNLPVKHFLWGYLTSNIHQNDIQGFYIISAYFQKIIVTQFE